MSDLTNTEKETHSTWRWQVGVSRCCTLFLVANWSMAPVFLAFYCQRYTNRFPLPILDYAYGFSTSYC